MEIVWSRWLPPKMYLGQASEPDVAGAILVVGDDRRFGRDAGTVLADLDMVGRAAC